MVYQSSIEQMIGGRDARQGIVFAGINVPLTAEQRTDLDSRLGTVRTYLESLLPVQPAAGGQTTDTPPQQA